jgi:hypothetical protein
VNFRTRAVGAFAWASSRRLGDCDTGAINQQAVDDRQGERHMGIVKPPRFGTTILEPLDGILIHGGVRVYFAEVTPLIAQRLLDNMNTQNRKMNKQQIARLKEEMKAGRFRTNHQGLAFDNKRTILDAQHRLTALVETDTTHVFLVSEGWDPIIRVTVDQGWMRQLRDNLRMFGIVDDGTLVAAVLNHIQRSVNSDAIKIGFDDAKAMIEKYEGGIRWICSRTTASGRGTAGSHIAAAFVYAHPRAQKIVDAAWADLQSGAGLQINDPVFRLREEIVTRTSPLLRGGRHMADADRAIFFRKTLNAIYHRVHGLSTKQIKVSDSADRFFDEAYKGK